VGEKLQGGGRKTVARPGTRKGSQPVEKGPGSLAVNQSKKRIATAVLVAGVQVGGDLGSLVGAGYAPGTYGNRSRRKMRGSSKA